MVRGWLFTDSDKELKPAAILINFTPGKTSVDIAEMGFEPSSVTQTTASPDAYIATPDDLKITEMAPGSSVELAPYSITLLK